MAIGKRAAAAMESLGRNPESAPSISSTLILALAFCEAIAIYALVVALAIKFVG
jgi:F-type H+-transporting ATPase subunit c